MTGTEILMIIGVPLGFGLAGLFGYLLVARETRQFDRKHRPAH
jgi:hypothetical protein